MQELHGRSCRRKNGQVSESESIVGQIINRLCSRAASGTRTLILRRQDAILGMEL